MRRNRKPADEFGIFNVMPTKVNRRTVDLSQYPNLVVVYLGMRVNRLTGVKTLFGFGPQIAASADARPDGLLSHEVFLWSLFPPHAGIRQYWRDLESLEAFTRSAPHSIWWRDFLRDSSGAGFWHESYSRQGMEAVYVDMPGPVGFDRFAPERRPVGPFMTARQRMKVD